MGESGIYYAINKNRPDIKEELDDAMRALDEAVPFYTADLYKRYFSMDYTPILTGEEKAWLKEHGAIKMGFLTSDSGVSTFDPATGEFTGVITDYIQFAADCLGNQELEFQLVGYDSKEAELDALKSGEIDMIFHFDQSPNLAEEYHFACTNTTWTSNLMAVTNKQHFNENNVNRIAVPQNKLSLKSTLRFIIRSGRSWTAIHRRMPQSWSKTDRRIALLPGSAVRINTARNTAFTAFRC